MKAIYYILGICVCTLALKSCSWQNQPVKSDSQISAPNYTPKELVSQPQTQEEKKQILSDIYTKPNPQEICQGEIDQNLSQEMSVVYPIGNHQYLVELLCFMGAYQGNYEYILYEPNSQEDIKSLTLETFDTDKLGKITKNHTELITGIPDYNSAEQTLTVFTKYRGLGDCGSFAKYKFSGKTFQIIEYRLKEKCDGQYLEPEQYSRIYP